MIALFVLWAIVVPGLNGALDYDDETEAGEVFVLAEGVTMDVQPGWDVIRGSRTTDRTRGGPGQNATLSHGGVEFRVLTGPYQGDVRTLLSQIEKLALTGEGDDPVTVSGDMRPFRTEDGERGLIEGYTTPRGDGVLAALVLGDLDVEAVASGPESALSGSREQLVETIRSIRYDPDMVR